MNFSGAFKALGYTLAAPRSDWSAERDDGVCLSLWAKEMRYSQGQSRFDSRTDAGPIEQWRRKPGATRRLRHLTHAVRDLQGWIDVVVVRGEPGGSYKDADPWHSETRGAAWRVTDFDPTTGHFAAETRVGMNRKS